MVWKFAFNYEIKEGWGEGEGERARRGGMGGEREGNVPCWAPRSLTRSLAWCEDCVISPSINSKWVVPSVATSHLFPSLSCSHLRCCLSRREGREGRGRPRTGVWVKLSASETWGTSPVTEPRSYPRMNEGKERGREGARLSTYYIPDCVPEQMLTQIRLAE